MNVRVAIQFDPPDQEAWDCMRLIGQSITKARSSVRVHVADDAADWLVVECTMPTEAQYKALDKVDRAVRHYAWKRLDSSIGFPKSDAERARARRKAQRRREKRREAAARQKEGTV